MAHSISTWREMLVAGLSILTLGTAAFISLYWAGVGGLLHGIHFIGPPRAALMVPCGSNQRQMAYAAIAYANDWRGHLPTRSAGGDPLLFGVVRLPILGFDTTTIAQQFGKVRPVRPISPARQPPGGVAFMMRDYLKNDWDVAYCPDGWISKGDGIVEDYFQPVATGYCWLPHRADRSDACRDNVCSTDQRSDIVRTASDKPHLLTIVDFSWRRLDKRDVFAANHTPRAGFMPPEFVPRGRPFAKSTDWPTFTDAPAESLPRGGNAVRVDCRLTWQPWHEIDASRYVVDGSVLMW